MISQLVTPIDQGRQVVATAQVGEQDGTFIGRIDLSPTPVTLRRLFEEYEKMVTTQMFSPLKEIEEKIEALQLKVRVREWLRSCLYRCADLSQREQSIILPSSSTVSR